MSDGAGQSSSSTGLRSKTGPANKRSTPTNVATMPGFRFQPTEEELVGFYLRSMVMGNRLEVDLINVLNLYRYDPWELPAMAFMRSEKEWLFFCPRDKKYPNGARPNRVTVSGYWKATGTDRPVRRAYDARCIGIKKTLVFYTGRAPRGRKTEWIMNEFRLPPNEQRSTLCQTLQDVHLKMSNSTTTELDLREVALCRIYKKPFQSNLISATANLFADNFMPDTSNPPGGTTRYQTPPKRVKLASHCNGSILDTELDAGISTVTTSTACNNKNVGNLTDLASNLVRYKDPGIPAPADDLSAQLMEPEMPCHVSHNSLSAVLVPNFGDRFCVSDHAFMQHGSAGAERSTYQVVDRLNWSDFFDRESVSPAIQLQHPGDLCPTMASIDRLLKASMWSPPPPLNLDYTGTLMKLDYGDDANELNIGSTSAPVRPNSMSMSSQFEWNSFPL